jgi:hypothetical protein
VVGADAAGQHVVAVEAVERRWGISRVVASGCERRRVAAAAERGPSRAVTCA